MKKILTTALKTYLVTYVIAILLFGFAFYSNTVSWTKLLSTLFNFVFSKGGIITVHVLYILFLILLLITKYFISVYKRKGFKSFIIQLFSRLILPVVVVTYSLKSIVDNNNNEDFIYEWNSSVENNTKISKRRFLKDSKIRGMSVYQIGRREAFQVNNLIKSNIEWVAVIPYFYQKDENTIQINTPKKVGIWSKRDSTFIKGIHALRSKGLATMIKPHLWMSSGWRSNINFKEKDDWNRWFLGYRKNMIHYATMAQETNAELFCIGTELRSSLKEVPEKWIALIKEIKSIYTGKLTYAANWDDTFDFPEFWRELDYIGIQAYFPLTENSSPNLTEIKNGWNKHILYLKSLTTKYNKPILFTEIGYRNDIHATKKPWEWGSFFERLYKKKSDKTQLLAYQALFEKLWTQDWFAGLFPWEWTSSDFPIYKKPSQNIITIWYHK